MKKSILIPAAAVILIAFAGCQQIADQAGKMKSDAEKAVTDASQQVEKTKATVLDTKAKIDEKVQQAQEAADAIKKFAN